MRFLVQLGEGSEEIAGVAVLVGVADELGVELLVALKGDAALLLVVLLKKKQQQQQGYQPIKIIKQHKTNDS